MEPRTSAVTPNENDLVNNTTERNKLVQNKEVTVRTGLMSSSSSHAILKAEEENLRAELELIKEMNASLNTFVKEHCDDETKRVKYDKYSKYLKNELETQNRELRMIKLERKTYETNYLRVRSQQQRKMELRGQLHFVDIDKLTIENRALQETLEQRTKHLNELKKSVVRKGQAIISVKTKLTDTISALHDVMKARMQNEAKVTACDKKAIQDESKLETAEVTYRNIKRLQTRYKSVGMLEYMHTEEALDSAKREKEHWQRRYSGSKRALTLLENQVNHIKASNLLRRAISMESIKVSCFSFN